METQKTQNTPTPPYISIPKLARLVEIIGSRNLSQITADHFTSRDFGKADAYLAMGTLRFLGLIEENGNTTESLKKFQLVGDQKKKAIEEVVKTAYKKLFGAFVDKAPYEIDEKELVNEFIVEYGMSQRTSPSAVKAFLWLCGKAGLVEETIKIQKRAKRETGDASGNRTSIERHSSGVHKQTDPLPHTQNIETAGISLRFDGGIMVFIPNSTAKASNAIALGELKDAANALNAFAAKFLLTGGDSKAEQNV